MKPQQSLSLWFTTRIFPQWRSQCYELKCFLSHGQSKSSLAVLICQFVLIWAWHNESMPVCSFRRKVIKHNNPPYYSKTTGLNWCKYCQSPLRAEITACLVCHWQKRLGKIYKVKQCPLASLPFGKVVKKETYNSKDRWTARKLERFASHAQNSTSAMEILQDFFNWEVIKDLIISITALTWSLGANFKV